MKLQLPGIKQILSPTGLLRSYGPARGADIKNASTGVHALNRPDVASNFGNSRLDVTIMNADAKACDCRKAWTISRSVWPDDLRYPYPNL